MIRCIGQNIENMARKDSNPERVKIPMFTVEQVKHFKPILKFLNEKDRDILYLIFVANKKQKSVQKILDRSQPSLCYDIRRIRRRLKFIFYLTSISDVFLNFLKYESEEFDSESIEVLTLMFYTTSFTQVAKVSNKRQIRIRYIFDKVVISLAKDENWPLYEIFQAIRENLNIVKRVYKEGYGSCSSYDIFVPV